VARRGRRPGSIHSEEVRRRIRTSALVNFLTKYALGQYKRAVDPARVTAALGVLKKTLPDLQSIEHLGEVNHTVHTVSGEPMSEDAWQATYGGKGQALN
jgi:hypothetical protein